MKPIRIIIHGAVVTIHSDFISVSVTRFVHSNCYGFDKITCDGKRHRATYSKQKYLSEVNDIDTFVDSVIQEFREIAKNCGPTHMIVITAADL